MSLTVKTKLVCQETDSMGYTTYVFELCESEEMDRIGSKYIMCTRWPNWEHRQLQNGEVGYLQITEIIAGKSMWYANGEYTPYKYSTIQFDRFITEQPDHKHEFTM